MVGISLSLASIDPSEKSTAWWELSAILAAEPGPHLSSVDVVLSLPSENVMAHSSSR